MATSSALLWHLDLSRASRDGLLVTPRSISDAGLRMAFTAGGQAIAQRAQTLRQHSLDKGSSVLVDGGQVGQGFPGRRCVASSSGTKPPDLEEVAVERVIEQAELFASEVDEFLA